MRKHQQRRRRATGILALSLLLAACADSSPLPVGEDRGGDTADTAVDSADLAEVGPDVPTEDTAEDPAPDAVPDTSSDADAARDALSDADLVDEPDADPTAFVFATDPPSSYDRVDRAGMPLVATIGISSQDAYNQADPSDDEAGEFLSELGDNFESFLVTLQDDLVDIDSCADYAESPADPEFLVDCLAQLVPYLVPDALGIDTTAPAGFPNGRALADPAVDITLALLTLDVVAGASASEGECFDAPCTATSWVGRLGPVANDAPFSDEFPYLAPPAYDFATDAPDAYAAVDRAGVPGLAPLFITSLDAYNQADPADDAEGAFTEQIVAQLEALHTALADDFADARFATCATVERADDVSEVTLDDCLLQLEALLIPDALKLDVAEDAAFPNGRALEDPALDVLLALTLLDVRFGGSTTAGTCGIGNCSPMTLVGANPTENDSAFADAFPYLAPAH
jgi:hypothetical protein